MRSELQIAQDRAKVCELVMKGYRNHTEIASIINENRPVDEHLSPRQVTYDLEAMKNEYIKRGVEDFQVYKYELVDELQLLKRTYWKAYDLSRRRKISVETDAVLDNVEDYEHLFDAEELENEAEPNVLQRVGKVREETRLEGNPAFLQGVQACIDRLAKIHGVDAPNKISMTDVTGTKDAVDVLANMKMKMDELESRRNSLQLLESNTVDGTIAS